jgi:hypothetical protein
LKSGLTFFLGFRTGGFAMLVLRVLVREVRGI